MNCDKHFNQINDYLNNELDANSKKEFENYLKQDSEFEKIVLDIQANDSLLKKLPLVKTKSNFIINITNDFWFGKYIGPYQHFYLTKIRAAEFNKPIIRVSNNGISAVIDNNGSVIKNTELNNNEKLKHKLIFEKNVNFVNQHLILKIYFFIIFLLITFYYLRKNV